MIEKVNQGDATPTTEFTTFTQDVMRRYSPLERMFPSKDAQPLTLPSWSVLTHEFMFPTLLY